MRSMYEITWRLDASSDEAAQEIFTLMKRTMDAVRGTEPGVVAGIKLTKVMDDGD